MSKSVVLTAVGRDRVGIVADLAEILYGLGCNLLDSSMTLLRNEFAIILMASLQEKKNLDQLIGQIANIEQKLGLHVTVRELSEAELEEIPLSGNSYIISVYGGDKPGIVSSITRKLADLGANITDVQTKRSCRDAKSAGTNQEDIFLMMLEVFVPSKISTEDLSTQLKLIAERISVDVTIQAMETVDL